MHIEPLTTEAEREACARIMATSEPWLTLGQTYEQGLALMQMPDREMYVAKDGDPVWRPAPRALRGWTDGEIAGFAIIDMHGILAGYLQTIAVAENFRGQGVGTQLIHFLEQRIFREKPNVFLFVSSFNPRAQRLYTSLGYETIGVVRDFLVKGHDEILMRKAIAPLKSQIPTPKSQ